MKDGTFVINGVESNEFNSLIQERPAIPSARRKINMRAVPGISGDYIFDEEAYENVSLSLSLYTKGKDEAEVRKMKEKVVTTFDTGSYIDLILYSDPNYVYEVIATESMEYQPDGSTPLLLPYTVGLSAKPFKRLRNTETFENESTIINPMPYTSKPEITLYGTGDMQLHVNGVEYPFQEIDEHVVIDSEVEHAYKQTNIDILNRNNRMYTIDFPVLTPGENTLSISGNATSFKVEPRWKMKL